MAARKTSRFAEWVTAGELTLAAVVAFVALIAGAVEMRVTLANVSTDVAEMRVDISTIEGLLWDRWTQEGLRDHADVAPTSVAVPISYTPRIEPRCATQ
ncbi:MAG: hypothetical protein V3V08_23585 [Nannocystaceae bacterium]